MGSQGDLSLPGAWGLDGVDLPSNKICITAQDINRYRSSQERFLNFTLDWSQPKLLLHAGSMEVLLVALGRRGKFQALPWIDGIDECKCLCSLVTSGQLASQIATASFYVAARMVSELA